MQAPRHFNTLHIYGVLFVLLVNESHNDCKGQKSAGTAAPSLQKGAGYQQDWGPQKGLTGFQGREEFDEETNGKTIASWDPGISLQVRKKDFSAHLIDSITYSGDSNDNRKVTRLDTISKDYDENVNSRFYKALRLMSPINSKNGTSKVIKPTRQLKEQSEWGTNIRERRSVHSHRQVSELPGGLTLWSSKTGGESNPSNLKQDYHSTWRSSRTGGAGDNILPDNNDNVFQQRDEQVKDFKTHGIGNNDEERFMIGIFNCFGNRSCRHPKADKVRSIRNTAPVTQGEALSDSRLNCNSLDYFGKNIYCRDPPSACVFFLSFILVASL